MSGTGIGWSIASAAEYGVAFVLLKVSWLTCLILVKRRNDELRKPFLWLKWAILLYLLFTALEIASQGINIFLQTRDMSSEPLFTAAEHIAIYAAFLDDLADIFMLACLVELNLSSLRVLGSFKYHQGVRFCKFLMITTLALLALAAFAEYESWIEEFTSGIETGSLATVAHLNAALLIIWWASSVPILAMSISVLVMANRTQRMQWAAKPRSFVSFAKIVSFKIARRLLVVSILNFVRSTYELYYAAKYLANWNVDEEIPNVLAVIDPILYSWSTVVMIGLLIAIGVKRHNGLWTDQCKQQEMRQWPQGAPEITQNRPSGHVLGDGSSDCAQRHGSGSVILAQYQQQQTELFQQYNVVSRWPSVQELQNTQIHEAYGG